MNKIAGRKQPRRPRPPRTPRLRDPFALREIAGHLTLSSEGVIAWYALPNQHWSFRSVEQRAEMIDAAARCYAGLVGHRIYLRGTTRPYPTGEWARALHETTTAATTVSDLPGCPGNTWEDHLARTQMHLRSITLDDKVVYLGVRLSSRTTFDAGFGALFGASKRELDRLRTKAQTITAIVSREGLAGRPVSAAEMAYLMHRSVALGLPAPVQLSATSNDYWSGTDLGEFAESVTYSHSRGAPTVVVSGRRGERDITRHVAVLTIGRMDSVEIPATRHSPWMQVTDQLPFPVEWMATLDLLSGTDVRAKVNRSLLIIRDLQRSHDEHGLDQPLDLAAKADRAREIEEQLTDGGEVESARAYGWLRLAVAAPDEEKCLERVRAVTEVFKPLRIDIRHPHRAHDMANQYALMREFIPGEPLSTTAYRRDLTLLILAAGMPTVSAKVGDRRGPYLGYTCGTSRRAVMFDPHYATEVQEASGLIPILGGLGSGKSAALGLITYESTRRNITTTVLDPSGPLARLTELPEFAGRARTIDLLRAPDGTLNPYEVIQPPPARNFNQDSSGYRASREWAMQDRKALAEDVIRMLLEKQVSDQWATSIVIKRAIEAVGADHKASLNAVIEALRHQDGSHAEHAEVIADYLRAVSKLPYARLFFGTPEVPVPTRDDSTLLVVTMAGLELPPRGVAPEQWSHQQRMSVPLLHLAAHYVTRRVYGLSPHTRKMVGFDEVGQMGQWGSGTALFNRVARDSRKWNLAAFVSSQDPADVLGLDIANKIGGALVGRIEDPDVARQALELLRVPEVYASVLAGLSPFTSGPDGSRRRASRQFLFRDVLGAVEKIAIDLTNNPALLDALDTTARPDQTRGAA